MQKFERELQPGDMIHACGISVTIEQVLFQDYYVDENPGQVGSNRSYIDIEFLDTNNQYRHYKSHLDGGYWTYSENE